MKGSRYKFGDPFWFTWSFLDQTSGFRDFFDDSYGRRMTRPSEINGDKLCFKVPLLRFKGRGSDYMTVLMSTALKTDPIIEKIKVLDGFNRQIMYSFYDLKFRVDLVGWRQESLRQSRSDELARVESEALRLGRI